MGGGWRLKLGGRFQKADRIDKIAAQPQRIAAPHRNQIRAIPISAYTTSSDLLLLYFNIFS
jgi:hypothetical protein